MNNLESIKFNNLELLALNACDSCVLDFAENIKHLDLSYTYMHNKIKYLNHSSLNLRNCYLTIKDLEYLKSNIKILDLRNNSFKEIPNINLPNLEILKTNIIDENINAIFPNLKYISLKASNNTYKGLNNLNICYSSNILKKSKLSILNSKYLCFPKLEKIKINNIKIFLINE